MPVAFPHFFRLVSHPFVDDPLINAGRGKIGRKTMAEGVEPADLVPFALRQGLLEVVVSLRSGKGNSDLAGLE